MEAGVTVSRDYNRAEWLSSLQWRHAKYMPRITWFCNHPYKPFKPIYEEVRCPSTSGSIRRAGIVHLHRKRNIGFIWIPQLALKKWTWKGNIVYTMGAQKWHFLKYSCPLRRYDVWFTCSEHREAMTGAPTAHGVHREKFTVQGGTT